MLVYPSVYKAPSELCRDGIVLDDVAREGEAWEDGVVVLACFAHALDQEDGRADGAPKLGDPAKFGPWARILGDEFRRLAEDVRDGRPTSIDGYGAISPAEFFAVVTEAFFGSPRALRQKHSALYEQLRGFYRQDPAGPD